MVHYLDPRVICIAAHQSRCISSDLTTLSSLVFEGCFPITVMNLLVVLVNLPLKNNCKAEKRCSVYAAFVSKKGF